MLNIWVLYGKVGLGKYLSILTIRCKLMTRKCINRSFWLLVKDFNCQFFQVGANTVKWTTIDPCIDLSGNYSKLDTSFEIYGKKNHKHLEYILIYKANLYWNFFLVKNVHKLEDGASGVQLGDKFEQENF